MRVTLPKTTAGSRNRRSDSQKPADEKRGPGLARNYSGRTRKNRFEALGSIGLLNWKAPEVFVRHSSGIQ